MKGDNFNPIWSADGRWVVYEQHESEGLPVGNIYRTAEGGGAPDRLTTSPNMQRPNSVSPDGAVLVFSEDDLVTGSDLWVLPLTGPRIFPVWSPDGREILYRGRGEMLMSAGVSTSPAFHADPPRVLFDVRRYENVFQISPDGRRLLMMPLLAPEATPTAVHVIVNWIEELRQRVR